jgi:crossover junction endodeoxyribonuclease RuvC
VYIGIDPSLTSTGVVILDEKGNLIESRRIVPKTKNAARLVEIENAIWDYLKPPNKIALEGYAYGSFAGREVIGELGGIIRRALYLQGSTYVIVPPATLKKFAAKGNAKKDELRLAAFKNWGVEFKSNDEVDAYILARISFALFRGDPKLTKVQQEILKKLEVHYGQAISRSA